MELAKKCRAKVFSAFEYYLRTEHNVRNILVHDDSVFDVEYPSWTSKVFEVNMFRASFDLDRDVIDHEYITDTVNVEVFEELSKHILDNIKHAYNKIFIAFNVMPLHSDYRGIAVVNTILKISIVG